MKIRENQPARVFSTGPKEARVNISDFGSLYLEPDEQITFKTESGTEYDVARKNWGYYALPSLNQRLPKFNLRPVLVKNMSKSTFLLVVEKGKEPDFEHYLKEQNMSVIAWVDSSDFLERIETAMQNPPA